MIVEFLNDSLTSKPLLTSSFQNFVHDCRGGPHSFPVDVAKDPIAYDSAIVFLQPPLLLFSRANDFKILVIDPASRDEGVCLAAYCRVSTQNVSNASPARRALPCCCFCQLGSRFLPSFL